MDQGTPCEVLTDQGTPCDVFTCRTVGGGETSDEKKSCDERGADIMNGGVE
jgi:hypothetical protein